jgi:NADP-dependent 3-hydroxy acid dehydrogenase YdfG
MADVSSVIWITGASSGIGLASARALAGAERTLILSGRNKDALGEICKELAAKGGVVDPVAFDATDSRAVEIAIGEISQRHGDVDVLINSAGWNPTDREWPVVTPESWDHALAVNLDAAFYCTRVALQGMRRKRAGLIVNIVSGAGRYVYGVVGPAYTASKHALFAMTSQINQTEAQNGIRACAFCPGEVSTPLLARRKIPPTAEQRAQMLQPEEVAELIAYIVKLPPAIHISEIVVASARR